MICIYKAVKDFVPRGRRRGLERGRLRIICICKAVKDFECRGNTKPERERERIEAMCALVCI